jgi:hypothetical protein
MTKIIKLTQTDLKRVINKALNEQNTSAPAFVKPQQQQQQQLSPQQPAPSQRPPQQNVSSQVTEQPLHLNDAGKPTVGPPSDILMAKKGVDQNLREALVSMKRLMILSGVNPQTNNIVQDIEKIIQKFDDLYGNPKPAEVKEKK